MPRRITKRVQRDHDWIIARARASGVPEDLLPHIPLPPPYPRFWPMVPLLIAISMSASYAIGELIGYGWPYIIVHVIGGMALGFVAVRVRWWIWRRRHPMPTVEEIHDMTIASYVAAKREQYDDMRRNAPFN